LQNPHRCNAARVATLTRERACKAHGRCVRNANRGARGRGTTRTHKQTRTQTNSRRRTPHAYAGGRELVGEVWRA
jgi:hypothetical protein